MKAIMIMYDSLNRRMLPNYGNDWVHAPNFQRLAKKSVTFANCYAGSLPCIPARRELHTGRYNFLHNEWGPLEPFDDSMPEILKDNGIYTHLVSDHIHYWEDGGCNYHTRYSSWEISRGQEGDLWKGEVSDPEIPECVTTRSIPRIWRHDWVNRKYIQEEKDFPQAKTFEMGIEFIKKNYEEDNWFLHIETFDPHEPYFVPQKYRDLYPHEYNGPHFDWPDYREVKERDEQVQHLRYENAALVSMCDNYLGKVLDLMDELNLWKDTMLIVNTDHGFLLGEHGWWAKNIAPYYNEIVHIPLFIWDPRSGRKGECCDCLVQTIDIPATLLDYFNVALPQDMQGKPLKDTIDSNKAVREAGLFGIHGGHVNCTDGRYVYMRAPVSRDNEPLYNYTLIPNTLRRLINSRDTLEFEVAGPFSFTKGYPVMKIKKRPLLSTKQPEFGTLLFDLINDPLQEQPIEDEEIEKRMIDHMVRLMKENDAPGEQYKRLGLIPEMIGE